MENQNHVPEATPNSVMQPDDATQEVINQMNADELDGDSFNILDEKDIMIGRGGSFLLNHIGNHYFQEVLEQSMQPYKLATTDHEKVKIVDNVMQILSEGGFRVLGVNDDGLHVVLSRRSLRRKVREGIDSML